MQSEEAFRAGLEPYGLNLGKAEMTQLSVYLDLLVQWNQHVSLVSAAKPELWVRRHFAESLYPSKFFTLEGRLIDIGSGAGFPGVPLKIAFPALWVTLLEPVGKKRAFLKEVIRSCGLSGIEVVSSRLEDYDAREGKFSVATSRAVGNFQDLIPRMASLLEDGGRILVWVSARQGKELQAASTGIVWEKPLEIPGTRQSQVWRGRRTVGGHRVGISETT